MSIPVLIDTDMGSDDAVAVSLALASSALDVRAVVGVGGRVEVDQVVRNIRRVLSGLDPPTMPLVGRGRDQDDDTLTDRQPRFGEDGLGRWSGVVGDEIEALAFRAAYRQAVAAAAGRLNVLAVGPLSNLANLIAEAPDLIQSVQHLTLAGGAVWTPGDVTKAAEFNFNRDPEAAETVLSSGLPITVVPLDVTNLVCLDQSHVAHLAASGYRTGRISAEVLEPALEYDGEPAYGKAFVPAAVAAGSMIWPDLFLKTRMRLEVRTRGPESGRSVPALGGDKSRQVDLLTAVNAVDLLENMLESLCHEAFVV